MRTVWLQVMRLEQPSTASQVRVAIIVFGQPPAFVTLVRVVLVGAGPPVQTPEGEGRSKFHGVPHSTVLSGAQMKGICDWVIVKRWPLTKSRPVRGTALEFWSS